MAKKQSKSGGNRKFGRNRVKCERYRREGRRESNKARRAARRKRRRARWLANKAARSISS